MITLFLSQGDFCATALGGQHKACKAYQNKILFSITTLRVVHLSCYSLHNRYLN